MDFLLVEEWELDEPSSSGLICNCAGDFFCLLSELSKSGNLGNCCSSCFLIWYFKMREIINECEIIVIKRSISSTNFVSYSLTNLLSLSLHFCILVAAFLFLETSRFDDLFLVVCLNISMSFSVTNKRWNLPLDHQAIEYHHLLPFPPFCLQLTLEYIGIIYISMLIHHLLLLVIIDLIRLRFVCIKKTKKKIWDPVNNYLRLLMQLR